jgi:hypothetical protein
MSTKRIFTFIIVLIAAAMLAACGGSDTKSAAESLGQSTTVPTVTDPSNPAPQPTNDPATCPLAAIWPGACGCDKLTSEQIASHEFDSACNLNQITVTPPVTSTPSSDMCHTVVDGNVYDGPCSGLSAWQAALNCGLCSTQVPPCVPCATGSGGTDNGTGGSGTNGGSGNDGGVASCVTTWHDTVVSVKASGDSLDFSDSPTNQTHIVALTGQIEDIELKNLPAGSTVWSNGLWENGKSQHPEGVLLTVSTAGTYKLNHAKFGWDFISDIFVRLDGQTCAESSAVELATYELANYPNGEDACFAGRECIGVDDWKFWNFTVSGDTVLTAANFADNAKLSNDVFDIADYCENAH